MSCEYLTDGRGYGECTKNGRYEDVDSWCYRNLCNGYERDCPVYTEYSKSTRECRYLESRGCSMYCVRQGGIEVDMDKYNADCKWGHCSAY